MRTCAFPEVLVPVALTDEAPTPKVLTPEVLVPRIFFLLPCLRLPWPYMFILELSNSSLSSLCGYLLSCLLRAV